jgi:hypothetical protein
MEKKVTTRTKKEKQIIEIPELKNNEFYWFLFSINCPEKSLHNVRHLLTGEMATLFLKQNYGVLC